MSDAHGHGGPSEDVPVSLGISKWMYLFLAFSLVLVMWQGYNVYSSSRDQHVWPASDAVKVPLPSPQAVP
ncbi:MAG: hypothetical protein ABSH03_08185 [Candidatus Lustribacter sp.]